MLTHVMAQWGRTIFVIFVGFLVPRFMNQYLGTSLYGTWQSLVSLTGILQLLALGVPMASVRFLSQAISKKNDDDLRRVISTFTGLYLIIGLVAFAVGILLVFVFDKIYGPNIDDQSLRSVAMLAVAIVSFSSACSFLLRLPYSVMTGYRYFIQLNIFIAFTIFIKTSLVIAVLVTSRSLIHLALIEVVIVFTDFFLGYSFITNKHPNTKLSISNFDRNLVAGVMTFGGYVLFLNMGTKLSFQIDSLVIGSTLTFKDVAYYATCNTIIVQLIEIMIAMAGVIMPTATQYDSENRRKEFKEVMFKWSKIALSITLLVGIYLLVAGPEFVSIWMKDAEFIDPSKKVLPILIISSFLFLPIRAVALPMLFGFGEVKRPALAFLTAGVLNLITSLCLAPYFGLFGVAMGTAIPNIVFSVYVLSVACKTIHVSVCSWMRYVLFKASVGGILVFFFILYLNKIVPVNNLTDIFILGIPSTLFFFLVWSLYVYKNDEYLNIDGLMLRIKRKFFI